MRERPVSVDAKVDLSVPVAPYYQLSEALREQIYDGRLEEGDRLPAVRTLAKECGVSTLTVKRAFDRLAGDGLLVSRMGSGTYVGPLTAPAIEVICPFRKGMFEAGLDYIQRITATVSRRYRPQERRCLLSMVDDKQTHAAEILSVCRARRVSGIIAFRPMGSIREALATVARTLPTVAMYFPLFDARADSVVVDALPAMRRIIGRRLEAGQRTFMYLGEPNSLQLERGFVGPYEAVYNAYTQVLGEAGIAPRVLFESGKEGDLRIHEVVGKIPDGATVLMFNPYVLDPHVPLGKDLDLISYTEYRNTRDAFLGRVSMLYCGIGGCTDAAVDLLNARMANPDATPRRQSLVPEVFDIQGDEEVTMG